MSVSPVPSQAGSPAGGGDSGVAMADVHRVSPRTLVVAPLREFAGFLAVAAGAFAFGGAWLGLLISATATVFGAVFHMVNWWTFTYRVYGDRIELRRALIGRSVKTIPLERVRGVDITASFLHRLFGLAVVRIDAAVGGESAEEGRLDAVRAEEAERLRTLLLTRGPAVSAAAGAEATAEATAGTAQGSAAGAADGAAEEAGAAGTEPAAGNAMPVRDEIYTRARPRWYLYGPLSGAFLLTPFAVVGSAVGFVYNLGDELGLMTEQRLTTAAGWLAHSPGLLVGALVVLVLLSPVIAVLAFAIFNWDFTLRRHGGSIVTERGLFTRRSVSLEHRRVRGVELCDNPFERAARVARLNALVTGLGDAATRGQLLPTSPGGAAWSAAGRVLGRPRTGPAGVAESPAGETGHGGIEIPLTAHPMAARRRRLFRAVMPWVLAAVLAALLQRPLAAYVLAALALLGVPLGLDRYRQLGHGEDGSRLTVRSGSLSRRRVVIEHGAVVGWRIKQTLLQRWLGLATLVVGVGAGEGGYRAIDMAEPDTAPFVHRITPAWVAPFLAGSPDPDTAGKAEDSPAS